MKTMLDWTWGDINNGDVGPGAFSWFHLIWLVIMIVVCIALGLTVARKRDQKADRIVVSVFSAILIVCEVFKQFFWFEFYGLYLFCSHVDSRYALAYGPRGYGSISYNFSWIW